QRSGLARAGRARGHAGTPPRQRGFAGRAQPLACGGATDAAESLIGRAAAAPTERRHCTEPVWRGLFDTPPCRAARRAPTESWPNADRRSLRSSAVRPTVSLMPPTTRRGPSVRGATRTQAHDGSPRPAVRSVGILGTGHHVPERVLDNDALERL